MVPRSLEGLYVSYQIQRNLKTHILMLKHVFLKVYESQLEAHVFKNDPVSGNLDCGVLITDPLK